MRTILLEEFVDFFKTNGELLPEVKLCISQTGRLPSSIKVKDLDCAMLSKILKIDSEFFENLTTSELTDSVWENMVTLLPDEYWDIAPTSVLNSNTFISKVVNYNQKCLKKFSYNQKSNLISVLLNEKSSMKYSDFLDKFLTNEILDFIMLGSNKPLIEVFGNEVFETEKANYIITKYPSLLEELDENIKLNFSESVYEELFKRNKKDIVFFPKKYQTKEKWLEVIKQYPNLIENTAIEYQSEEMWLSIVKTFPQMIEKLPAQFSNQHFYDTAFENNSKVIKYMPGEFVGEKIATEMYDVLYKSAMISTWHLVRLLPYKNISNLMDEKVLELYLKTEHNVKLDYIKDELLNNEVLKRILEKNPNALSTLSPERRTVERYEIAATFGYCDSGAPEYIKKMFDEKKQLNKETKHLEEVKTKIVDYEKLIIDYINSSCKNIEEFCEKSLFYKALEYVEQYNTELYDCYKEFANIKEKEGFDYVSEIISKILELYKKDNDHDKTTSKNNFNVVNYWLITDFEPRKMLRILKYWRGISPAFIVEFSQKILKNSKTNLLELEAYKNTKYTFATGTLPQDKKVDIVNFLINNGVPINTVSLSDVSRRFMSNQIDLSEIYEKIHYDVNDFKRSEIREKSKIIVGQIDTISSLDAMISKLSEEKENLDFQIKGGKK